MEEAKAAIKKVFKNAFSPEYRKRVIQALVVVVFFLVLLASAVYYITVDDGTYKEDDWSSTPYGASQYTGGISVEKDGTLKSGTTAQELWDKMLKNKNRVDKYLSNPEELARLMRAEIITQYPDTRPEEEIDKEIDWDKVIESSDLMQGIIKFKRANTEGNKSTMSYVDPETFQGYIDEYNRTGSETAKQNALNHFTLKKASSGTTTGDTSAVAAGEGIMTDVSQLIINVASSDKTPWPGANYCAKWVDDVYDNAGVGACRHATAYESSKHHMISTDKTAIPIGAAVYGTGSASGGAGHIGIYIGSGKIVDSVGSGIKVWNSIDEWVSWQTDVIDGKKGWLGWGWEDNNKIRGTTEDTTITNNTKADKKEDKKENKKNKDKKEDKDEEKQKATVAQVDGDGYSEIYTSSTGISYKHYKQFIGSYAGNSYWDGTIANSGCGPSSVAILASGLVSTDYDPGKIAGEMNTVYGYTSYMTLQEEMNSLGMESEVIQSPSAETIQEKLREGKVMLVSVDSNTIFTSISHLMAVVDINEQGQVYICNPGSSVLQGWYDVGELMKGCQYIVVTDAGKGGAVAPSKNTSNYVAVVATWRQIDINVTSDDPGVQSGNRPSQYTMTTTNVNYEEMVAPYTMPFDLLWSLLVVGEDKKFVFELADLIYHSDIQITIHDNLTVNTDIDEWHYTLRTKAEVDARIKATCKGNTARGIVHDRNHDPYKEDPFTTTKTVVTQTNTVTTALTKANVWIVDYENEYIYLGSSDGGGSSNTVTLQNQEYSGEPDRVEDSFSCEHIDAKIEEVTSKVKLEAINKDLEQGSQEGMELGAYLVSLEKEITAKYYTKYINMYDNISHGTTVQKYVQGTPSLTEKVDKETAPNFVTIFNKGKYRKNKINIKNASEWLFEIIETNDSTADMWPDLIRFLLYKATGNTYDGVDEFDFSVFKLGSFKPIGGGGNLDIKALTETTLSKEEFVALVQGYSAAISKGAGTADFRNNADIIYDVCVQNHINPVFCVAQAWREQNWIAPNTSPYNYWGIAVYNGQNYGSSWPNMESAVQGYCDQVNSQATMSVYIQRAQEYAALDSRFKGDMSTLYDVFSAYCYKGDQYSQAENAKYVGDYIDSLSTIAQQIFGVGLE